MYFTKRRVVDTEGAALLRRQAAYMEKVLPTDPKGAFDIISGDAYLRPPSHRRDEALEKAAAAIAFKEVFCSEGHDEWLKQLAEELPTREQILADPDLGKED